MIWGAGAKGVMFLNPLQVAGGSGLDRVVDINPRKQGHFVPLSGQRIIGPERLLQDPPDLVIVMNPEYECEARSMIDDLGIVCDVVSAIRVRFIAGRPPHLSGKVCRVSNAKWSYATRRPP